jgi:hypothetical protein
MTDPNPKQIHGDYKVPLQLVPPGLEIYAAMALGEGGLWKDPPYGPYNFRENPVEAMTYIGAILRHVKDYLDGYDIDPDSPVNKPSLAGVAGSLAILIDATENGNLIDNRPKNGNARAMMDRFEGEIRAMKQLVALVPDSIEATTFGPLTEDAYAVVHCPNCDAEYPIESINGVHIVNGDYCNQC